jgi:hypothetical protein
MILRTGAEVVAAIVAAKEIQWVDLEGNSDAFPTATAAIVFIIDNPIGGRYEYRSVAKPDVPVYHPIK